MRNFQKLLLITTVLLSTTTFAAEDHKTLQMTVINNTDTTLTYVGATGQNPGNVFSSAETIIPPQSSTVMTGKITADIDLAGNLHFRDAAGNDNALIVIDPRNIHIMQPLFSMRNARMHSTLKSQKHGDSSVARGLLISESKVQIDAVE
jgi:hypothetical protein